MAAEALMPTWEGKISSENPSLLCGPIRGRAQLSEAFNYTHLVPCRICIISPPVCIKACVYSLFVNSEICHRDVLLIPPHKLNTMPWFILQTERSLSFALLTERRICDFNCNVEWLCNHSNEWLNHKQSALRTATFLIMLIYCVPPQTPNKSN